MRQKKVWRYYCDHCNKGGCGKHQMEIHERHCTMNPNRICRMCEDRSTTSEDLSKAITILPNPEEYKVESDYNYNCYSGLEEATEIALLEVRELLNNCPACILSALRQKSNGKVYFMNFNYTNEVKQMWKERNKEDYIY